VQKSQHNAFSDPLLQTDILALYTQASNGKNFVIFGAD